MKRLDCWGFDEAPEFVTSAMGGGKSVSDIVPRIRTLTELWVVAESEPGPNESSAASGHDCSYTFLSDIPKDDPDTPKNT